MLDVPPSLISFSLQKSPWFRPGTALPAPRQTAPESKPRFHPEALRQQVRAFNLPERVENWQPKLQEWARLIASGRADEFEETASSRLLDRRLLRPARLHRPGGPADPHNSRNSHTSHLSGTGPAESPDSFTFSRERHVQVHSPLLPLDGGLAHRNNPFFGGRRL